MSARPELSPPEQHVQRLQERAQRQAKGARTWSTDQAGWAPNPLAVALAEAFKDFEWQRKRGGAQ